MNVVTKPYKKQAGLGWSRSRPTKKRPNDRKWSPDESSLLQRCTSPCLCLYPTPTLECWGSKPAILSKCTRLTRNHVVRLRTPQNSSWKTAEDTRSTATNPRAKVTQVCAWVAVLCESELVVPTCVLGIFAVSQASSRTLTIVGVHVSRRLQARQLQGGCPLATAALSLIVSSSYAKHVLIVECI